MMTRALMWVAMVLALSGAVPSGARADWDDRPDPAEFQQSLDPNGYWVDDSQFGHVWRPPVAWGWQPYVDGQWVWSSYGWTWSSPEPWGWTFHYGRWGFSNLYGWVWTPGYVWGPAWVNWYWGDGLVGWAPLGPPGFVVVPTYWNYVHDYAFCSPRVSTAFVGHRNLPSYVVHHQDQGWGMRHAPDFRDIERVSRHQIVRETDRPRASIAPWVEHRLERGERVRERIASRDGDRVIDHPGRGPERGDRPNGANDAWHRPADRDDRQRNVPRQLGSNDDAMNHGGRTFRDDQPPDQERQHGRVDDGDMAPHRQDRDDRVGARPAPETAPSPHVMERPGTPSMGYRGGGGGGGNGGGGAPTIVERGRPGGSGGGGPSGGAHPGGPAIQHGAGGGAPHGGGDGGAPHGRGGQQSGGGGASGGGGGASGGSPGGGGFGGGSSLR